MVRKSWNVPTPSPNLGSTLILTEKILYDFDIEYFVLMVSDLPLF